MLKIAAKSLLLIIGKRMQLSRIFFLIFALLLSACSDPVKEQLTQQIPITEKRINDLANALENGQVRNANLINQYADKMLTLKPHLAQLIGVFKQDASTRGPMYNALLDRLDTIKNNPQMFTSTKALYEESLNLYQAADPVLFSDALSDPLNVLADMSDGELPRINSLSKEQSMLANKAQDFGVGEQLIGNPSYGNWQSGSNGTSFWAWYGMYSLMGDVFGSRRHSYSNWGRNRNYSYYNDYGRTRYSSPSQLSKQTALDTRTKKSFSRSGKSFTSAYDKNRSGASGVSSKSRQAQSSLNKFTRTTKTKSSFGKTSSSSSSSSSFRNSSSSTSRSFSRGK